MTTLLHDYVDRGVLSRELKVSKRTLIRWQHLPNGLPHLVLGGRVLYRRSSVAKWLAERERYPNPQRDR